MDPATGVISGTPSFAYNSYNSAITVTGQGGSSTYRLNFKVTNKAQEFLAKGYEEEPIVVARVQMVNVRPITTAL